MTDEQLRVIARRAVPSGVYSGNVKALRAVEAAVRADMPREVQTVEELDALNLNSVVVDFAGVPRVKRAGNSYMAGGWTHGGNSPLTSKELADGHPITVVYEGRTFTPSTPNQQGGSDG